MTTLTVSPELKSLAKDLTKDYPRSPKEILVDFAILPRVIDKCRAILNGTGGEYNFNCPLDRFFFDFSGVDANAFEALVATGASDEKVGAWVSEQTKVKDRLEVVKWTTKMRYARIQELPDAIQLFFHDHIPQAIPGARVIYAFDIFDFEEKRM